MDRRTSSKDLYLILKDNARKNRNNMTEAESVLWLHLKDSQMGCRFLRQHIIGDYIVDFLCRKTHLVIEVDGGYHNDIEQQRLDKVRTQWLEENGFKVIRFTNEEVLFDIENVLNTISNNL